MRNSCRRFFVADELGRSSMAPCPEACRQHPGALRTGLMNSDSMTQVWHMAKSWYIEIYPLDPSWPISTYHCTDCTYLFISHLVQMGTMTDRQFKNTSLACAICISSYFITYLISFPAGKHLTLSQFSQCFQDLFWSRAIMTDTFSIFNLSSIFHQVNLLFPGYIPFGALVPLCPCPGCQENPIESIRCPHARRAVPGQRNKDRKRHFKFSICCRIFLCLHISIENYA